MGLLTKRCTARSLPTNAFVCRFLRALSSCNIRAGTLALHDAHTLILCVTLPARALCPRAFALHCPRPLLPTHFRAFSCMPMRQC
eukprot:scaffold91668_cov35-Tisochrysis_lutea.AAC.1